MKKRIGFLSLILLISCAKHPVRHGTIAMKVSDNVANVALHNVEPGEKVALVINKCVPDIGPGERPFPCREEPIAEGWVSKVINEHYAEVTFPSGVKVAEGQMVEPINH
jgi:hypothetical protein